MRILGVAGCLLAAVLVGGCASNSAGSGPTARATSAVSHPATAMGATAAPSAAAALSTPARSSASASATEPATLPADDELARVAEGSQHPGLAATCHGRYAVDAHLGIRRTSTPFGPAAVVPITCQGATAGSPQEIGIYVPQGESARRTYVVLGANGSSGRYDLNTQRIQLSGTKLHLVQSGLAATDPLCCPSLWYAVDYTLTATGATGGRRVPIPAPIQGGAQWTSPVLVITAHGLGAVSVGMTMTQAAHAAGFASFTAIGDGVSIPTPWHGPARSAAGYPELYVSHWAGPAGSTQAFTCVGAFVGTSPGKQMITTPEGVRLGDPASRVVAVYGSRAHYVPAPSSGMDPRAGYVISHNGYDLVFKLDPQGQRIVAIVGGLAPVNCVG